MVRLWTARPLRANERIELGVSPPWKESSICIGDSEPDDPSGLFPEEDYQDLLLSYSSESIKERLLRMDNWTAVEGWIARRDTPQCRWLDRLVMIDGHLGEAILELIRKRALIVKQVADGNESKIIKVT